MTDILDLFRKFTRYSHFTDQELIRYLTPSIKNNQYKKHYQDNNLIGFTNWALLSNEAEKKILNNQPLQNEDWNSGNNIWHIETVCIMNLGKIISWTKNNLAKKYGLNKIIKWARIEDNKIRSIQKIHSKDNWLWVA
nr:ACP:hemolysin acyltransferase (hemolysin-activating protein) (HlyC) [uncultured Mediterranean phage uvMED]